MVILLSQSMAILRSPYLKTPSKSEKKVHCNLVDTRGSRNYIVIIPRFMMYIQGGNWGMNGFS